MCFKTYHYFEHSPLFNYYPNNGRVLQFLEDEMMSEEYAICFPTL